MNLSDRFLQALGLRYINVTPNYELRTTWTLTRLHDHLNCKLSCPTLEVQGELEKAEGEDRKGTGKLGKTDLGCPARAGESRKVREDHPCLHPEDNLPTGDGNWNVRRRGGAGRGRSGRKGECVRRIQRASRCDGQPRPKPCVIQTAPCCAPAKRAAPGPMSTAFRQAWHCVAAAPCEGRFGKEGSRARCGPWRHLAGLGRVAVHLPRHRAPRPYPLPSALLVGDGRITALERVLHPRCGLRLRLEEEFGPKVMWGIWGLVPPRIVC